MWHLTKKIVKNLIQKLRRGKRLVSPPPIRYATQEDFEKHLADVVEGYARLGSVEQQVTQLFFEVMGDAKAARSGLRTEFTRRYRWLITIATAILISMIMKFVTDEIGFKERGGQLIEIKQQLESVQSDLHSRGASSLPDNKVINKTK